MTFSSRSSWWIAVLATEVFAIQPAIGDEIDISGEVTVVSDYVFRGVSQSMSAPALQASLTVEHDSGWYGCLWASNVDFTKSGDPDDGASLELDVTLGYAHEISDRAAVAFAWTNYIYPDLKPGFEYSYSEWLGSLSIDERHSLTVGYSRDVFAAGAPGVYYAVGTGFGLTEQIGVDLELGYYDLDRVYGMAYGYADLSISGTAKFLDWRVSYLTTSSKAGDSFHASAVGDRVVLALGVAF